MFGLSSPLTSILVFSRTLDSIGPVEKHGKFLDMEGHNIELLTQSLFDSLKGNGSDYKRLYEHSKLDDHQRRLIHVEFKQPKFTVSLPGLELQIQ
ncbi:Hypothetical predicted protein [Octopus vulgaris]|uniref:Uncharacterized protein n=1 Tax=Octopus vulgaris TaxID=6645 RepID=A0AA36AR06_OCTVU|nr:Hypothetical predicted protein [Octopus vulgaris]